MAAIPTSKIRNRLLGDLPSRVQKSALAACNEVKMPFGQMVYEQDQEIPYIFFPQTAVISMAASTSKRPPLGLILIGNEGMLGATLVLGVKTAPLSAIVQRSGTALRMDVSCFQELLHDNPSLNQIIGSYLYVFLEHLSQTAFCAHYHDVQSRLVSWLLLTHDRAHADTFHLTHKFLADMLGVQRSAITIAAGALQKKKLISYLRGEITIVDRPGLQALSCGCYGAVVSDYRRMLTSPLLPPPSFSSPLRPSQAI